MQVTSLIENIAVQWKSSSYKPLYKKILKKPAIRTLKYVKILNMNQLSETFALVYLLFF